MRKAQSDPDAAYADAIAWHRLGGGLPARHCAAVALVGKRQFDEAAARLETLSRDAPPEDLGLRPGLLEQAAQAWPLSGRSARAAALPDPAIAERPRSLPPRAERQAPTPP